MHLLQDRSFFFLSPRKTDRTICVGGYAQIVESTKGEDRFIWRNDLLNCCKVHTESESLKPEGYARNSESTEGSIYAKTIYFGSPVSNDC